MKLALSSKQCSEIKFEFKMTVIEASYFLSLRCKFLLPEATKMSNKNFTKLPPES